MKKFSLKLLAIISSLSGIYLIAAALLSNITFLEDLPNANLVPELEYLTCQGRYADAVQLGRDMKKCKWQSDETQLDALLKKAEDEEDNILLRSAKFIRGFVTGSPKSADDGSGAVISDLLLYGDVRDLIVQGGRYITGNASDPIITGTSSAGLLAEAVPVAGWFPATLKILRKTDSFTPELASHISRSLKFFKAQGKLSKSDRELISDLYKLISCIGLRRSVVVMRHIHNPSQLKRAILLAQHSPEQFHLTVRATQGRILLSIYQASPWELMRAGQKGVAGLETLQQQQAVKSTAKLLSSGTPGAFIRFKARNSGSNQLSLIFAGAILLLCAPTAKVLNKRFAVKEK